MSYWYYSRAAGIVAWLLLAVDVGLGVGVRLRSRHRSLPGRYLLELHRHTAGLAIAFVAAHLFGVLSDTYVEFTLGDILIPFASEWNPAAVTWGVVSMYLLVAAQASGQLRRRLSKRWWTWLHRTSYGLFITATVHGVMAGTDAANGVVIAMGATLVAAVVALTAFRLTSLASDDSGGASFEPTPESGP